MTDTRSTKSYDLEAIQLEALLSGGDPIYTWTDDDGPVYATTYKDMEIHAYRVDGDWIWDSYNLAHYDGSYIPDRAEFLSVQPVGLDKILEQARKEIDMT